MWSFSSPKGGISSTLAMVAIIIVIVAVAASAYVGIQLVHLFSGQNSEGATSFVGNNISVNENISVNSTVDLTCNSCSITFNIDPNVTLKLNVAGNSNHLYINGGSIYVEGTGNSNMFYLANANALNNTLAGNGNCWKPGNGNPWKPITNYSYPCSMANR
jgi:hypothetical protein